MTKEDVEKIFLDCEDIGQATVAFNTETGIPKILELIKRHSIAFRKWETESDWVQWSDIFYLPKSGAQLSLEELYNLYQQSKQP